MNDTVRIPIILVVTVLVLIAVFAIRKSESTPVPQNDSHATLSRPTCNDVSDCKKIYDAAKGELWDHSVEPTRFECIAPPTDPSGPKSCYAILETGK